MDEKSLSDLFSKLVPDELEARLAGRTVDSDERDGLLIEALRSLAGQSESSMATALNEFLNGKGVLLERTRSAVTRGGKTATNEVADFLKEHFNLSASVAKTIATLLVRLFPSISMLTGEESISKPKPRRRTKPKTASSAKPASASKPRKRKTATSARPAASRKSTKRKTSTNAKPASSSQPKKRKTASNKKPASASKPSKQKTSTGTKSSSSSKAKNRGTATRSIEIPPGEEM